MEGKQTDHGWNRAAGIFMQVLNLVVPLCVINCIFYVVSWLAGVCIYCHSQLYMCSTWLFFATCALGRRNAMQVFNVVILLALIEHILRPDQITFMDPETGLLSIRDSDSSLRDKVRELSPHVTSFLSCFM